MTAQSILQTCVTQAAQQGPNLMAQWLAAACQSLAAQAQDANTAETAAPALLNPAASRVLSLLQQHGSALCQAYGPALLQQFLAPPSTAHANSFHSDELALVDATEHDAQVELLRAQEQLGHATDSALSELNALVSAAQGLHHVQADTNPLRPANYLRALQQVLAPIAPTPALQQLCLQHLLPALGPSLLLSYQQAVAYLRQQGVRPANYGLAASHFSAAPAPVSQPSPRLYDQAAQAEEEALTASILHQLLQGGALPYGSAYASLYGHLQSPSAWGQQASMYGGMATDAAMQAADIVAQMMDHIAQDERLLPPIRQALLNMEPALVQLAAHDAQFFNDPAHPARQLLDDITERGLAFQSEASPGFHAFMHLLDQVVQRLSQQEHVSAAGFTQILQALHKAWKTQAERAQPAVASPTPAPAPPPPAPADPQQVYQRLCTEIAQNMRRLPDSSQVPAPIMDFATGVWAQVIARVQLEQQHAHNTENDPHGYLALVPLLFWSVRPGLSVEERQQIAPAVPDLLQNLTQGLQHIAHPTSEIQQLLRLLKRIHQDTLSIQAPPPPPTVVPPPSIPEPSASVPDIDLSWGASAEVDIEIEMEPPYASQASAAAPVSDVQAQAVASPVASSTMPLATTPAASRVATATTLSGPEFAIGTWVELQRPQQTVRTQLTWVNPSGTLFLFTAPDGSTQSMTRRVLDRLWATGELRRLSSG